MKKLVILFFAILALAQGGSPPKAKEKIFATCVEELNNGVDTIKMIVKDAKNLDIHSLFTHLQTFLTIKEKLKHACFKSLKINFGLETIQKAEVNESCEELVNKMAQTLAKKVPSGQGINRELALFKNNVAKMEAAFNFVPKYMVKCIPIH